MSTDFFVVVGIGAFVVFLLWLRSESHASPPVQPFVPLGAASEPAAGRYLDSLPGTPQGQDDSPLKILNYSFRHTDWRIGPPDAETFMDELLLELYDERTGHRWMSAYTVATPKGLSRELLEPGTDSIQIGDLMVVRRFDRDLIIAEVRKDLAASLELAEEQERERERQEKMRYL
jgi:hypothetical protein